VKVAVTGASGFLGSAAVRALPGRGMEVAAVSRQALADPPAADVLIHLAESGDRRQVESGGERYRAEVLGQLDVLLRRGYRTSIYVSSAVVYGDASSAAHKESDAPRPADAYARLKLLCETRTLDAGGVVLRVANVYGPGMAPRNVISTVLAQIPGEGPLRVMDESPRRDFLWIGDLAAALACAAQRAAGPAIFNIGSGIATSIGASPAKPGARSCPRSLPTANPAC
jgi:nucleoside-diphosphate-sugar epimerase